VAAKLWMTSEDLVAAVKRKITLPDSQELLTDDQILSFLNEEMAMSMVPSMLSVHEEFFVTQLLDGGGNEVTILADTNRYPIPSRALGSRLRDLFYKDNSGDLQEMTRINPEDKAYFNRNLSIQVENFKKYYIEGNDIVLLGDVGPSPTGTLVFTYYLTPNQLVDNSRAAIIQNFKKTITVDNGFLSVGDQLIINGTILTAVSGAPGDLEFQIGGSSTLSAVNLAALITSEDLATATNNAAVVSCLFDDSKISITTTDESALDIQDTMTFVCEDDIPSNITLTVLVDFIKTKPGHQDKSLSIPVEVINNNEIDFDSNLVPNDLVSGDYVANEYECIIPQIPSVLHVDLVERGSARILAAIGDQIGLETVNAKIQQNELKQGILIDNRVEGSPQKVINRQSLLRLNKSSIYRRY
jgi:hypothetical protein